MALAKNSLFISYRKDDAGGWAARLADELRAVVGNEAVFIDDSVGIPPGSAWPDRISIALDQCRVFIPVIAPDWHQEPNLSRLKNPEDWVRKELTSAHNRQASVLRVPVFVNEAGPLDPTLFSDSPDLQTAVQSLMDQQGIKLDRSPEHWPGKIDGLVTRIEAHTCVSVSRQSDSSEQESVESVNANGSHQTSLNFQYRVLALLGMVIVAPILWFYFQPKPNDSFPATNITNSPTVTVSENQTSGDINTTVNITSRDSTVAELVKAQSKSLELLGAKDEQIAELTKAVQALVSQQSEPDAPEGIGAALDALAQGDTKLAEAEIQSVIDAGESESQKTAEAYRHLGALAYLHDTTKALNAYRRSTELDPANAAGWTNLGLVYKTRGKLDKAEENFLKALKINEALGRQTGMANVYGNLGDVYREQGKLDKAEEFHLKALKINKALGQQAGLANVYNNLGIVHENRGEHDKAEEIFLKALKIDEVLG